MELMLLEVHCPLQSPQLGGFILFEPTHGNLEIRVRKEWPEVTDPVDREYLEQVDESFRSFQRDMGNAGALEFLEGLSNLLRLSGRLTLHHEAASMAHLADRLAESLLSPPTQPSD